MAVGTTQMETQAAVGAGRTRYSTMWPLTDESRQAIVRRIAQNLAAISFFSSSAAEPSAPLAAADSKGNIEGLRAQVVGATARLDDEAAQEHALVIEREAYTAADAKFRAQAQAAEGEGAGARPLSDTQVVNEYAQHASNAMLALLAAKFPPPSAAARLAPGPGPAAIPREAPSPAAPEHVPAAPAAAVAGAAAAEAEAEAHELDLSKEGKREFLDPARAQELLQPMLKFAPNNHVKVRLSNKCFRPGAAAVVAQALRNAAATLRHADLSDIIAGQPEDEALQALAEISGALQGVPLLSLDLSNNALGEKGVRACASALSTQRSLEALWFCNNGISAAAGEAIVELLPPETADTLTTLHFHNNMTGDDGAVALAGLVGRAAASHLRDFRFSSTRVQTTGGVALAEALARGSSLERLDLRDNMFGEAGAGAIADTLSHHRGLREVYLGDTALASDGVCTVVKALAAHCKQLRVLDLEGNEVSAEGAQEVAENLEGLPLLTRLVLSVNEIQDEGAVAIATAVAQHNMCLEVLDLCTNELGDKGAKAAANAALELPNLKALLLNGNSISKAGIAQIKDILAGRDVLGPLDENDDGEDEDDD